jgi:hypothetical protein
MDDTNTCYLKGSINNIVYDRTFRTDDTFSNIIPLTEFDDTKWKTSVKTPFGSCPFIAGKSSAVPKIDAAGTNCSSSIFSEADVNYPGNNMFTFEFPEIPNPNNAVSERANTCDFACKVTPGCNGYTFDDKTCSIKSKMAYRQKSTTPTTAVTIRNFGLCPNKNEPQNNMFATNCFGQCENDSTIPKFDEIGSNCTLTFFGVCSDGKTLAKDTERSNCPEACESNYSIFKTDPEGTNCPGYTFKKTTPTTEQTPLDVVTTITSDTSYDYFYDETELMGEEITASSPSELIDNEESTIIGGNVSEVMQKGTTPDGLKEYKFYS